MADRVVKVTLRAEVDEYKRGMAEAAAATRTAGTEVERLAQQKAAFDTVGRAALGAGVMIGAFVATAVSKFVEFDAAMSNVQAATHESAENMGLLREAALEAGARTVYSASEAAAAVEELAKAGVSTADVLGGALDGALDLAAAGEIEVAAAAEIAASTMTQFGLAGRDVTHIADLLAAGAGKAQGGVTDLSQALNQSGLVASQMGLSVEETVGSLAMFASAGLIGSDAGTSFRNMLLRLVNPTGKARELMDELGLSFYDAQGEFIGMEGVAGQLEGALGSLSEEQRNATLATLFGQDAIRAAAILYEGGAEKVAQWTSKVDDAGYAAETAATRLDNLAGDWEALGGAVDSALISIGSASDGLLRAFVQVLTDMVDGFNDMPAGAQQAVFWVGAVATAAGIGAGAFLLLTPKIVEYKNAIEQLGPAAQRTSRLVGFAAKGLGAVGVAAAAFGLITEAVDALDEALFDTTDRARNLVAGNKSLEESFNELNESGTQWVEVQKVSAEALDRLGDLDNFFTYIFSLGEVGHAATRLSFALKELSPQIASLPLEQGQHAFAGYAEELGASREQMLNMLENMPEFKDALIAEAEAQGIAATDANLLRLALGEQTGAQAQAGHMTEENTAALAELQGQASETTEEVEDLADAIRGFGDAALNTRDANRQFESAIDDLQASLKDNGAELDISTEKGRANEASLDALAESAKEYAASLLEETGSQELANEAVQRGRDELIKALGQFGITGQAAEDYADKLGLIPENISTAATLTGVNAAEEALARLARDRWARVYATVVAPGTVDPGAVLRANGYNSANFQGNLYDSGKAQAFASGGFASGIYPGVLGGIHKFAESEMGVPWEAYISGRAADRDRNIGIAYEALNRLGAGPQAALPPIYVQNPFTGEYLLAQVDGRAQQVAGAVVQAKSYRDSVKVTGGGMSA